MPTYKVTDPTTGRTIRLTGDSPPTEQEIEQILASVQPQQQAQPENSSSNTQQFLKGLNDSTAAIAGLPVDAMTAVMNLGISGLNQVGLNIPEITNPVGGSQDLRSNQSVNAALNTVGTDIGNPQDTPAPEGIGQNIANIAGQAVPAIVGGSAAFRNLPQATSNLGKGAQGAGIGAAEGNILSQNEDPIGKLRDTTIGGVLGVAGIGVAGAINKLSKGKESSKRVAELLESGELDNSIVGKQLDNNGNLVNRPQDKAAQTQGFSDGVIVLARLANNQTKAKFGEIVNVITEQQRNIVNQKTLRPTDVVGKSIVDRFVFVNKANRDAGKRLNGIAKSLENQPIDISSAVDNFTENLAERLDLSLVVDDTGKLTPNFRGSSIEGRVNSDLQDSLNIIIERARDTRGKTALDAHKLKQSLDRLIDFDKVGTGLKGNVEGIISSFRKDIDGVLDSNFPEYKQVNDIFSETRTATDSLRKVVGKNVNLNSEGISGRVGTLSRRIFSNAASRTDVENAAKELTEVANRNGADFQDDIVQQSIFASELEDVFKISQSNSFKGEIVRSAAQIASGDRRSGVTNAARAAKDAVKGVDSRSKILAIKELLK